MYIKLEDASGLFFSSCQACQQSCCDGGRFVLAPLVLDDFDAVYKNFLIAFAYVDGNLRVVMLISNKDKACQYYKDNLCTIYDSRPPACVMYPFTPYYDEVFIDSACEAVGYAGFELRQNEEKLLDQVHPSFYHERLVDFSQKLAKTELFLHTLEDKFEDMFEVQGIMLMKYKGSGEHKALQMHQDSLVHVSFWKNLVS